MLRKVLCPNFNHRRSDAPVRFCPNCGDIVNKAIPATSCSTEKHAGLRKRFSKHCVHCGEQLIAD